MSHNDAVLIPDGMRLTRTPDAATMGCFAQAFCHSSCRYVGNPLMGAGARAHVINAYAVLPALCAAADKSNQQVAVIGSTAYVPQVGVRVMLGVVRQALDGRIGSIAASRALVVISMFMGIVSQSISMLAETDTLCIHQGLCVALLGWCTAAAATLQSPVSVQLMYACTVCCLVCSAAGALHPGWHCA